MRGERGEREEREREDSPIYEDPGTDLRRISLNRSRRRMRPSPWMAAVQEGVLGFSLENGRLQPDIEARGGGKRGRSGERERGDMGEED